MYYIIAFFNFTLQFRNRYSMNKETSGGSNQSHHTCSLTDNHPQSNRNLIFQIYKIKLIISCIVHLGHNYSSMSSQTMPDRSYDNRANVYALSHKICYKSGTCTSQLWVLYCPYINPIVQCPFVVDNQLKVINKTFKDFLTGSYLSECSIAQNMLTTPNFVKSCVYSQRSKTFV